MTKINDQNITPGNYRDLFGGTGSKKLTMADWKLDSSVGPEDEGYPEYILTNSGDVNILMHRNFAENPVYRDSVYTIGGDQKKSAIWFTISLPVTKVIKATTMINF